MGRGGRHKVLEDDDIHFLDYGDGNGSIHIYVKTYQSVYFNYVQFILQ